MAFRQKVHPQQVGDHLGIGAVIFLLRSGDRLQHLGMGHFQINSVRLEENVNPASENSCFHRSDPGTRQSLHPFAKRLPVCINLSLADKTAIQGFDAISYYPLVNVQPDVVKYVHGNLLVVSFWASQSRPSRLPHANILNHLGVSFNTDHLYIQTLPVFLRKIPPEMTEARTMRASAATWTESLYAKQKRADVLSIQKR